MPAIHNKADQMYLINCPHRGGLLTWKHDNKTYVMAFTSSDKAEEYNSEVLDHMPGNIKILHRRESVTFARRMVARGVDWMVIDYPPINDTYDEWNPIPRELGRDYGIVHLKHLVEVQNGKKR